MSEIIRFGTDGWRARLDGDFTNDNVVRVADAAGALWARRAAGALVYVGYDARPGAREFARLAGKVLAAHGLAVKVSDRHVPTPALAWTVARDDRAVGGLMVTGSHSPADYRESSCAWRMVVWGRTISTKNYSASPIRSNVARPGNAPRRTFLRAI